jgi:murein DD-endopeptidase MepM/ murein hydrolase activator NlpD
VSTDIAGLIDRVRATAEAVSADGARSGDRERIELQRVAQQFEAMLLTQMLREMRKASEWGGDDDEGAAGMKLGTESFTEAIDTELGIHLARSQGLGLTSQLMQAFDRLAPGLSPAGPTVTGAAIVPDAPTGDVSGATVVAPIAGQVTSAFGWRSDPFTGQARFHRGVDLKAVYGQDVQAAASGTVVVSGEQGGYGTTVVIEHSDGSRTRYAHLSAASVPVGSRVEAGQEVGRAGKSGRATGTHLHFEVTSPDGKPLPPGPWLQGRADARGA